MPGFLLGVRGVSSNGVKGPDQLKTAVINKLRSLQKLPKKIASFFDQRRQRLSRWGISYILGKYVSVAKQNPEFSADFPVTPHVLRHSKAMGMLKAGINLIYIRDFLGHVNVTSTEVYARADNEMKRKYLEQSYQELNPKEFPNWEDDTTLLAWLDDLCR